MAIGEPRPDPGLDERPHRTIRPRKAWLPADPGELWEFRSLLVRFAARDVTLRYRQTVLGVTWVVLQPLLGAGILAFVFGNVAGLPSPAGIPYFVFSLAGMVAWTAFSQAALRSSGSLLANAAMVQKVFFPRMLLPLSAVLSSLVDVAVSVGLLGVVLALNGIWAGLPLLTFPFWLLLVLVAGIGLGLMTSALAAHYRDIQYVIPVGMQFLLYASPVAYALAVVPEGSLWVYKLNPLTGLLEGIRWSTLGTAAPSSGLVLYSVATCLVLLVVGMAVFGRMERQVADVI